MCGCMQTLHALSWRERRHNPPGRNLTARVPSVALLLLAGLCHLSRHDSAPAEQALAPGKSAAATRGQPYVAGCAWAAHLRQVQLQPY